MAKVLAWLFWAANLLVVVGFWAANSGAQLLDGTLHPALALGRLAGLLATYCVLVQFVLMGREGWLEPIFGMDRIARVHRLNGYTAYILALTHPTLLLFAYSDLTGNSLLQQFIEFELNYPYVFLASIAATILTITVGLSIYIVRKRLRFETWYYVHLMNYLVIALVPFHQLANGGDLLADQAFAAYWIGLYLFAAANFLGYRWGWTIYRYFYFRFRVDEVVAQAPRATSVYITGRNMQRFRARAGQFVLVRFLTKGMWWQEHPFSLSQLPDGERIRLTIRQLGDFTNEIPNLKPGTKVMISGPHGAFTHQRAVRDKVVYIVGGVGITPIYSMLQELANDGKEHDAVMLYGNRAQDEIIFAKELDGLSKRLSMPLHHVLSDDASWEGEKGFIDQEKMARLVPDIIGRDVFLCGPPPMMAGVIKSLRALGVPERQIHFEQFDLHPKKLA